MPIFNRTLSADPKSSARLRTSCRTILFAGLLLLATGCAVSPQPLTVSEQRQLASDDRKRAAADVPALTAPLTLAEALARALKYNLDHRTRMMEEALSIGQLDLSRYDMLPKLTAAAGYSWRDNERITRSQDSVTGLPSLANPYISSDRSHVTRDLGLTWNILDFGVSYQNSKQNADRVLVAAERRRKAMHLLMQDVRTAYWRTASAQHLEASLRETIRVAEARLARFAQRRGRADQGPDRAAALSALAARKSAGAGKCAAGAGRGAHRACGADQCAGGSDIRLAEPREGDLSPRDFVMPIEQMEETAIANNADLKEQFYSARIAAAETRKSMLKLFPGLSLELRVSPR